MTSEIFSTAITSSYTRFKFLLFSIPSLMAKKRKYRDEASGTNEISKSLFLIERFWINFIAIEYYSALQPVICREINCYDRTLAEMQFIRLNKLLNKYC